MKFQSVFILSFFIVIPAANASGKMVYLHQQGEIRQVALADRDGTGETLITPADKLTYHPEISSDGRFVAYSIGDDFQHMAIEVQDRKTGGIEVWTEAADQYIHAEFSTDGRVLAFSGPVGKDGQQSIGLIDLEKVRTTPPAGERVVYRPDIEVIDNPSACYFPAVASDGSFIVFHCTHDENRKQLFLYNRATGEQTPLTDPQSVAVTPSLSFDDRHVAYAGKVGETWDLFVIDLLDKKTTRITRTPEREFTPVFTPAGDLVYTHFGNDPMNLDLYQIRAGDWHDGAVEPVPFIAAEDIREYIPAFSGDLSLQLRLFPPIPEPARSSFGAVRHQGKIFIAGGHQGPEHTYPKESFLDRLDIFDEKTRTWTSGAPLSLPRHGFQLAAYGPYVYAFGGFAFSEQHEPGWKSVDLIERYDIENDRWEVIGHLPRHRSSNVVAQVGTEAYLIGGWDSTPKLKGDKAGRFHPEIDVFDLESETVKTLETRLPPPLRRALSAVVYGKKVFLLGGIREGTSHVALVDRMTHFDTETGAWEEWPALPFATFAPGAGLLGDAIFLIGGMQMYPTGGYQYLNHLYRFDLATREWQHTGRSLSETKGFPQLVPFEAGLAILGGHSYQEDTDAPVSTFEVLAEDAKPAN